LTIAANSDYGHAEISFKASRRRRDDRTCFLRAADGLTSISFEKDTVEGLSGAYSVGE
jgi:hypothetical protein